MVHRLRPGHVQALPARVTQPAGEVDLVGVDEELRVEVVDLCGRVAAHQQRRGLAPVHLADVLAAALHDQHALQPEREGERARRRGEPPRARLRAAVGSQQERSGEGRPGVLLHRPPEGHRGPGAELGVLVEQQRVAAAGAGAAAASRWRPCRCGAPARSSRPPPGAPRASSALSRRASSCRGRASGWRTAAPSRSRAIASRHLQSSSRLAVATTQKLSSGASIAHIVPTSHARPRRRPLRLHAALRPRAVLGAGRRGRRGDALHESLRLRRRSRSPTATSASSASTASPPASARGAAQGAQAGRARPGHARLPPRGPLVADSCTSSGSRSSRSTACSCPAGGRSC